MRVSSSAPQPCGQRGAVSVLRVMQPFADLKEAAIAKPHRKLAHHGDAKDGKYQKCECHAALRLFPTPAFTWASAVLKSSSKDCPSLPAASTASCASAKGTFRLQRAESTS